MINEKVQEVQESTIKEAMSILKKYRKCLVVRPTGFGKTKIALDIASKYTHAVFCYPFNNIKNDILSYGIDIKLLSYSNIRDIYKSGNETFCKYFEQFNRKNTIFIFDEAHFLGGYKLQQAVDKLMEICPKASYLGITATPRRTDRMDIKWHFFDGHVVSEYGIADAVNDMIFKKPHYVYTPLDSYDLLEEYNEEIDKSSLSKNRKELLKEKIKTTINPERMNIRNLGWIIQSNIPYFENDNKYYKFIAFFTTFNDIHRKKKEVEDAFKYAFPDYNINSIIVSSETNEYKMNLDTISGLVERPYTIDIIFNCNMLSFGYHTSDITGILMFRYTVSNIIYSQQVGRCFSVIQKYNSIIFDFVENLSRYIPNSSANIIDPNKLGISTNDTIVDQVLKFADVDQNTYDLLNIDRIYRTFISEEFEEEVVKAYRTGLVDIEYCMMKLDLQSEEDFNKLLEKYKEMV